MTIAKAIGQYFGKAEIQSLGERNFKRTGESEVYINVGARKVFKIKNPYAKSPLKRNVRPEDAIYEHLIHNKYFPETAYGFVGISEVYGDLRIVLSQDYVESVGLPTETQIEAALLTKGLRKINRYVYGNEEIEVTDVTGDNALLGLDGTIYFIDPVINILKPIDVYLG